MQGTIFERIVDLEKKVERLDKKDKSEKGLLFRESTLFDKREFAKVFTGWSKEQCAYYYNMAFDWSENGKKMNRKKDWQLTIQNWARRDEAEGRGFFGKGKSQTKVTPKNEGRPYDDRRTDSEKERDRLAALDAVKLGRDVLKSSAPEWVSVCCSSKTRIDNKDGDLVRICQSCGKPCEWQKKD